MRKGKPSGTSTIVTFSRALNHLGLTQVRDFSDPFAEKLLPPLQARLVRGLGRVFAKRPEFKDAILKGARGKMDVVALRSRAIDTAWDEAYQAGIRQLVILGAGLDARAYRLANLKDVSVYEVDHPSTQALKRMRTRGLMPLVAALAYVPVDLSRDKLDTAIIAAGFHPDSPSFWIWEGVTPYLTHQATASTLGAIASVSAPQSQLVMTYIEPDVPGHTSRAVILVRTIALRWVGEPHIGMLGRAPMAELLKKAGWRVRSDEGQDDLTRRFSDSQEHAADEVRERVVVAQKG